MGVKLMTFEIVEKSAGMKQLDDSSISVGKTGTFFGTDIATAFDGFDRCEIYLDFDERRVGFKPSNDKIKGFVLGKAKDGKQRKSLSGTWVKQIAKGHYTATKNSEGMFVINVKEIARKSEMKQNGDLKIAQV
jgi:hypothetical protein